MTLNFLGKGSAGNLKLGNTSAYYIENNTLLLIDCGFNIYEKIIKQNIMKNIKRVFILITHTHPDHVGSLGNFIFYCNFCKNINPYIYFSSYYTRNDFGEIVYLKDNKSYNENITNFLMYNGIVEYKNYHKFFGKIYDNQNNYIKIKSVPADHYYIYKNSNGTFYSTKNKISNRKNYFQCKSFIIDFLTLHKKIFYSGDTKSVDFNNPEINKCDEFYIECATSEYKNNPHYNIDKIYKDTLNAKINPKKIFLMHIDCDYEVLQNKAALYLFNLV